MRSRSSLYILIAAGVLGLFFGWGLGEVLTEWFGTGIESFASLLGAILLAAIAVAGAWVVTSRYEAEGTTQGYVSQVQDPPFARFLFQDTRAAAIWLPLRLFVGVEWLNAGWHKFTNPKWMDTGEAIRGYWQRAVTIPEQGSAPITYDWWRSFLQGLLDSNAHTWFAKLIVFGELLVGLGLIFGALVGIAAFSGALMNISFLLSGSTSSNPVMLLLAFVLVLAWKVAGWFGLDRYLLPALGTPWQGGRVFQREAAPPVPST